MQIKNALPILVACLGLAAWSYGARISGGVTGGSSTPGGSPGTIQYNNATSLDGTQMYWDNTNYRIGIGTDTPDAIIHWKKNAVPVGMILHHVTNTPLSFISFLVLRVLTAPPFSDTATLGFRPFATGGGLDYGGWIFRNSSALELFKFDTGNVRFHIGPGSNFGTSSLNVAGDARIGSTIQYSTYTTDTNGLLVEGGIESRSYLQSGAKTLAQFSTSTPTVVGQRYYCTDCVNDAVCYSTGTTVAGQWSRASAKQTKCS